METLLLEGSCPSEPSVHLRCLHNSILQFRLSPTSPQSASVCSLLSSSCERMSSYELLSLVKLCKSLGKSSLSTSLLCRLAPTLSGASPT